MAAAADPFFRIYVHSRDHVHEHRSNNKHLLAGYHLRPIHLMSGILERYPVLCRESIGGSGSFLVGFAAAFEPKKKSRMNRNDDAFRKNAARISVDYALATREGDSESTCSSFRSILPLDIL